MPAGRAAGADRQPGHLSSVGAPSSSTRPSARRWMAAFLAGRYLISRRRSPGQPKQVGVESVRTTRRGTGCLLSHLRSPLEASGGANFPTCRQLPAPAWPSRPKTSTRQTSTDKKSCRTCQLRQLGVLQGGKRRHRLLSGPVVDKRVHAAGEGHHIVHGAKAAQKRNPTENEDVQWGGEPDSAWAALARVPAAWRTRPCFETCTGWAAKRQDRKPAYVQPHRSKMVLSTARGVRVPRLPIHRCRVGSRD